MQSPTVIACSVILAWYCMHALVYKIWDHRWCEGLGRNEFISDEHSEFSFCGKPLRLDRSDSTARDCHSTHTKDRFLNVYTRVASYIIWGWPYGQRVLACLDGAIWFLKNDFNRMATQWWGIRFKKWLLGGSPFISYFLHVIHIICECVKWCSSVCMCLLSIHSIPSKVMVRGKCTLLYVDIYLWKHTLICVLKDFGCGYMCVCVAFPCTHIWEATLDYVCVFIFVPLPPSTLYVQPLLQRRWEHQVGHS